MTRRLTMYILRTIAEIRSANILKLRNSRGFTQAEASEVAGIPLRTYQRAEDPELGIGVEAVASIASGFGVPISAILEESQARTPPTVEALSTAIAELQKEVRAKEARIREIGRIPALIRGLNADTYRGLEKFLAMTPGLSELAKELKHLRDQSM